MFYHKWICELIIEKFATNTLNIFCVAFVVSELESAKGAENET